MYQINLCLILKFRQLKVGRLLLCSLLLIFSFGGIADAANFAYPLTFQSALRQALENRIEISIEEENLNRAQARVEEARGMYLPSLDFSTTAQNIKLYNDFSGLSVNANFNGTNIPISVQASTPAYQLSSALEINYNLYSGGATHAGLKDSLARRQGAIAQREISKKKVLLEITNTYWSVSREQIVYSTSMRNFEYAIENEKIAREQFKHGKIAKIELDAKVLGAETREVEMRSAMRVLRDAQRRYSHALGSVGYIPSNREDVAPNLPEKAEDVNIEKLLSEFNILPELEVVRTRADFEGARARIELVKSEYKPTLDLFARYSGIGRGEGGFGDAQSAYGRDAAVIGVRLKWNLFNGLQTSHRVTQAVATAAQTRLIVEQAERELNNDWQEKQSRESDVRDHLELAKKQMHLAQAQLIVGKARAGTQTISRQQYRAIEMAFEDARNKVDVLTIDLLVSRIALYLARIK